MGPGTPFFPRRRAPTRSVDPGAHEFLLKAAISLSPDKSWWVIRRHQSRCQRRLRRGPHRLPIHTRACTRIYIHARYTYGIRERARWTNFFGLFQRQTAVRCYVKLGEKAMGTRRAVAPSPCPTLLPLKFLMRTFSGHCPRKSRTAVRTTPRGAPKCSGLFPLPPPPRWPLPLHLPVSSLLFSLFFHLFFFFLCYFGRALNIFPSAASRVEEVSAYVRPCALWLRSYVQVFPRATMSNRARGSGIVLFHGLTAERFNRAIGLNGYYIHRGFLIRGY